MIPGPAGNLEAMVNDSGGGSWVILCHPHPIYGGSMFDAVLDTVEQALTPMNLRTLRFNFRGVGSSEGEHDHGEGEVNDLLAVVEWLCEAKNPSIVSVAGYSFGSVVASRGVANNDSVSRVVLVAPPTSSMALATDLKLPVRIIVGDADPFVDLPQLQQWQHDQNDAEIVTISGADHFFGGQHQALQSATSAIFSEALPP
tara:strand:+ start:773 stop:1372 length:600 start_codon:yes stop_codon:yes gene_type:complete